MREPTSPLRRKLLPGLAAALLLALPPSVNRASAQAPPPQRPRQGSVFRDLGLSAAQERDLSTLLRNSSAEAKRLRRQMEEPRRALARMLRGYSVDRGRAEKLIREINGLQLRLLQARLRTQIEMRRILTADQWSRMQKQWQEGRARERGPQELP